MANVSYWSPTAAPYSGDQPAQDLRQELRQVLGNQAGPERGGGLAMKPSSGTGGLEARHALRQQAGDEAGKYIAGAGRREPGRRIGVDRRTAVGLRNDGVGSFEQHDRTKRPRSRAGPLQ